MRTLMYSAMVTTFCIMPLLAAAFGPLPFNAIGLVAVLVWYAAGFTWTVLAREELSR